MLPAGVDFKESVSKTHTGRASPLAEESFCVWGQCSLVIVDLKSECTTVWSTILFNPFIVEGCLGFGKIFFIVSSHVQNYLSTIIVQRGSRRVIIDLCPLIAGGHLILQVLTGTIYIFLCVLLKGELLLTSAFTKISQCGRACSQWCCLITVLPQLHNLRDVVSL